MRGKWSRKLGEEVSKNGSSKFHSSARIESIYETADRYLWWLAKNFITRLKPTYDSLKPILAMNSPFHKKFDLEKNPTDGNLLSVHYRNPIAEVDADSMYRTWLNEPYTLYRTMYELQPTFTNIRNTNHIRWSGYDGDASTNGYEWIFKSEGQGYTPRENSQPRPSIR